MSSLTLRDLQVKLKSTKRSMRKYMPLIGKRTGLTAGMIAHYFDGHGTSEERCKSIIDAVSAIQSEIDQGIIKIHAEEKQLRRKLSTPLTRKYTKHQTF